MDKFQVGKLHPTMSVPCGGGEGCLERFVTGPGLTLSPGEGSDLGRFGRVRCKCRALFARERVLYLYVPAAHLSAERCYAVSFGGI